MSSRNVAPARYRFPIAITTDALLTFVYLLMQYTAHC